MRHVILTRDGSTDEGTPGRLTTDEGFECSTLELPWRENAHGVSCIPPGVYEVRRDWSPKRSSYVYELQGVPGRGDIQIHPGNFAGDRAKGKRCDVEGCILLGQGIGAMYGQLAVLSSRKTVADFAKHMGGMPFTLEIRTPQTPESVA